MPYENTTIVSGTHFLASDGTERVCLKDTFIVNEWTLVPNAQVTAGGNIKQDAMPSQSVRQILSVPNQSTTVDAKTNAQVVYGNGTATLTLNGQTLATMPSASGPKIDYKPATNTYVLPSNATVVNANVKTPNNQTATTAYKPETLGNLTFGNNVGSLGIFPLLLVGILALSG